MCLTKSHHLSFVAIFLLVSLSTFAQPADKALTIGTSVQLNSTYLNETRTVKIYIPEDYSPNDTANYPVIYIPDGAMEEDFIHIAGLVRFNTQPWIARFPKSIVVGIENTNRKRNFT